MPENVFDEGDELDIEELTRLVRLVEAQGVDELIVEEAGLRIVIRGGRFSRPRARQAPLVSDIEAEGEADDYESLGEPAAALQSQPSTARIPVVAPMVGVFYRASGPDTPPYVDVGDRVEIGQIIGMIEAMKVFSEVPSEVSGTVVEVLARNGQLVRPGEPLMYLA